MLLDHVELPLVELEEVGPGELSTRVVVVPVGVKGVLVTRSHHHFHLGPRPSVVIL